MEREYKLPARYIKLATLGKGAAGKVFKVKDTISGNIIALKILNNLKTNSAKTLANEFKTLSSLDHTGLIKVCDFGILQNNIPYFTMELINGRDLRSFISQNKNLYLLPDILEQIINALSYLHKKNILHGDIKPENIMLINNKTGQITVKLLDFGLASASSTIRKSISGTPRFLAPKILKNAKYSESSDLYALGMTLIESITGIKAPIASNIRNNFYEENYKLLSGHLSAAGVKNAFSLSLFILDLCRIDRDERISDSKEALQETWLLASKKEHSKIKLNENILVGRDKELEEIDTFLSDDKFNGKTLILEGKRGVGKKKLLAECVKKEQLAGQFVFDLSGDLYSDNSFDRFIETLSENLSSIDKRKLISSHKKILSSIAERNKSGKTVKEDSSVIIYDNIIQFIHKLSIKQPVLICIPDINRFSADFLRFTNHLVYETDFLGSRTRVIISKSTDISISRIYRETYQEITALEPTSSLNINPLGKTHIKQLAHELLGDNTFNDKEIRELHERTDGIPLFLIEVLKQLASEGIIEHFGGATRLNRIAYKEYRLPETLKETAAASYRRLTRKEKNILQAAAFFEKRISVEKLSELLSKTKEDITQSIQILTGKKILHLEKGYIEFNQSIFKEFIRAKTSWKKRVSLNSEIGRMLEGDKSTNSVQLAKHFIYGRVPDKALKYGLLAAGELKERYEIYDCLDLLAKLKKLIKNKGNSRQLYSVLELIAPIELQAGLTQHAIDDFERLIELGSSDTQKAEYYKELGIIYSDYLGKERKPKKLFDKALELAVRAKNKKLQSEILLNLSELTEDRRLAITNKAARIAKGTDINTYAIALSKYLYHEKIGGNEEKTIDIIKELEPLINSVDTYTRKKILSRLSSFYFFSGDYDKIKKYLDIKLKMDNQTNDGLNKILSLRMLGGINYINGEFHEAINILKEITEVAGKYKALLPFLTNISNLALMYYSLAEYNKAMLSLNEGIRIIKEYRIKQVYHRFTGKFCLIYHTLGNEKENDFQKYYKKTKENALRFNNTIQFGISQLYKTRFYSQRLQCGKTVKYIQKALKSFRKTNDRDDIVDALITLSMINLEEGKHTEAAGNLKEARAIFNEIHCRYLEPSLLLAEGGLARKNQTQKAEKILKAGLKLSKKMGTRETTWQLYRQLALYYRANGQINETISNYRNSIETIRQITESIEGDKLKTSYLSVPFRKRVFDEIRELKNQ
ncbi:MAG: protein kinase [Candidatus Krumholzibacteriota bacterium]|nr:protein kinase [Candidatus Krumholzibacteriota bacterium]